MFDLSERLAKAEAQSAAAVWRRKAEPHRLWSFAEMLEKLVHIISCKELVVATFERFRQGERDRQVSQVERDVLVPELDKYVAFFKQHGFIEANIAAAKLRSALQHGHKASSIVLRDRA